MRPIRTSKRALRRLLLEKQLLLRPSDEPARTEEELYQRVKAVIRQLECVQIDPVSAVRPNQHLTLAARIPGYEPRILNGMLRHNEVFEYLANAACVIPMEDYPMFEPVRQRLRERLQASIEAIRSVADGVIHKLENEGPLPAKAFQSEERVHGYWDNVNAKTKATSHALNLLMDAAEIRIVGREGNQRHFDVIRRCVPAELQHKAETIDPAEALDAMLRKYFRAYSVFEPSDPRLGWQRMNAAERRQAIERYVRAGEAVPVELDGVKQTYYVLAGDVGRLEAHQVGISEELDGDGESIRFLPPLDNLLWSRKRLEDLFEFEYRWEIYTPAVKRKYGYYAMPILAGDRLIGRMDPRLNSKEKHLSVQLLQIDPCIELTERLNESIQAELQTFARSHGAETVSIEHCARQH